jgi:hypothetical protein
MTEGLEMWTVYDHPKDFPKEYVARKFVVDQDGARPTDNIIVSTSLKYLRYRLMSRGLVALTRNLDDEPQIVETWL